MRDLEEILRRRPPSWLDDLTTGDLMRCIHRTRVLLNDIEDFAEAHPDALMLQALAQDTAWPMRKAIASGLMDAVLRIGRGGELDG